MEGSKRRRLGSETWRELFRQYAAGGESVSAFCQRKGVSMHSFRRWRARLGDVEATTAQRASSPTRAKSAPVVAATGFVDLGALGATAPAAGRLELRLDLGAGITLHVVRG
jgi:hypothetical protein